MIISSHFILILNYFHYGEESFKSCICRSMMLSNHIKKTQAEDRRMTFKEAQVISFEIESLLHEVHTEESEKLKEQEVDAALRKIVPDFIEYRILSQSLDARGAPRGRSPKILYRLEVRRQGEVFKNREETFKNLGHLKTKPLIVGAGPGGLFAALRFAEYGIPCVIFERGGRAGERMKFISKYWRHGIFNDDNNVCYGEGGAGLFSDGKLITRVKSPYVQYVMNKFVHFGAPPETAYISNPHLGSNKIRALINKITDYLIERGTEIHYDARVSELIFNKQDPSKIDGVRLKDGREFFSDHVILATGHSAREVYTHLKEANVAMKAKDFAVGVRIEHPRRIIDFIQYGKFAENGELGAARYRLSYENKELQKGTYSFCMCPGGYVLSSGTDADGIVVNGMSNYARNSKWSNAALVVSIKAGVDFDPSKDVLAGMDYQHDIERKAYEASLARATGREVPYSGLKDFLDGKISDPNNLPITSCPSGVFAHDLHSLLPGGVAPYLQEALGKFDGLMKGFVSNEARLLAPETRTSAPITILRDSQSLESISHRGLYPCGEGAGYAGGITSAAVDGVRIAMSILKKEKNHEEVFS
jgi:uncharacterized FAD-dependent dehydrogenase